MIPVTAVIPFSPGPIACAGDIPLSVSVSGQPVMSEAILDWFRPMIIGVVTATLQDSSDPDIDGTAKEVIRSVTTSGCFQPGDEEKLEVKIEGERSWQNGLLHVTPDFDVPTDSVIVISGVRYRTMSKKDFSANGFIRYKLLEDYHHA